jgi:Glycerol-3-phosphate dehydrogenase
VPHENIMDNPKCSSLEKEYLIGFVNQYFNFDLKLENIVWSYSGIRPLYKDSKKKKGSVSSITRDYKLKLDTVEGLPILNIYGGKLTTYRKLSENVLLKLRPYFTKMQKPWTSEKPLPGGDFDMIDKNLLIQKLSEKYRFLDDKWCRRLINCYGTLSEAILRNSETREDLGLDFGHSLSELEVIWLINNEFASCAEDILWRRTKLGLKFSVNQEKRLSDWFQNVSSKIV